MKDYRISNRFFAVKKIASYICSLACMISCTTTEYNSVKVEPVKIVKSISDSVYLSSQVSSLSYANGRYYLSDYYRGIISFDESFNEYAVHEMNIHTAQECQCSMFSINEKGEICMYDSKNHNFVFERNNSEYGIIDSDNIEITQSSRFIFTGDTIICPITKSKMTAAVFSPETLLFTCFPTISDLDDIRMPFHSERLLVRTDEYYFCIGKGLPVIQMFSSSRQQVYSYDLNNIEEISQIFKQEVSNKANSYFVVVKDACAFKDSLFLLIASKKEGKYKCNRILKFIIKEQMIEFDGIYELKGKVYSCICVNGNNQLVAITSKSSCIEIYDL
ncbi:hypothetical protein [Pseudobutyrivibrio sp.]